jgi:threonine synthase
MWRHLPSLPVVEATASMGEEITPLDDLGGGVLLKHEELLPTGSFKARGAAVMMSWAAAIGVESMVTDSSGNAGLAAAAYARAAGIPVEVFVPEGTDESKVAGMQAHSATVIVVEGTRADAAAAARLRVGRTGAWYASHAHQPAFHHGVKTLAFELVAAMGDPPEEVWVPAGNGTLVIGLWLGFRELANAGHLRNFPRIMAVQARACAPLTGAPSTAGGASGPTAATGVAVAAPPRLGQVRAAVAASGGTVLALSEEDISAGASDLRARHVEVSATGALAWSAWIAAHDRRPAGSGSAVIVVTGR